MTSSTIVGLVFGVFLIAFGAGHANGARGRTMFPAAWIDGLVLAFVGLNVLIFAYFGFGPGPAP
ncbi:hypothetical protein D3273_16670 [Lichenibacterium minor]|uniref:Uncharacterized protein n=1 Tax=Lichenibacterium minor TaxID=2316528 RepID=A0A4V1RUE0_9HYPH|nr:hypothetical protein [Lichenibacterium minor]RYC30824.1 hypothetical protein D3273_16670 [Lichenibacterium minor]